MADRQYGGFWRRLFAFLIDQVILYFVSLILFLIGLLAFGFEGTLMDNALSSLEDSKSGIGNFAFIYIAASLISGMTYFTLFHGITGQTPGKMLFGLRVIQTSGDPITPGIAFLRWVGYMISGPIFSLGFLWAAFDGRKQGWHDKIAATIVIRRQRSFETVTSEQSSVTPVETLTSGESGFPTSQTAVPVESPLPAAPNSDGVELRQHQ